MEGDRIDKSQYKEVVEKEKKKLLIQVGVMTLFAAVVSFSFLAVLLAGNPHTQKWSSYNLT